MNIFVIIVMVVFILALIFLFFTLLRLIIFLSSDRNLIINYIICSSCLKKCLELKCEHDFNYHPSDLECIIFLLHKEIILCKDCQKIKDIIE
jgi:hypothetical protein